MSKTQATFPFFMHTIIRASAGAGKTFALSSQFIALLNMGFAPQTILATTFTRKAAGEILQRVLSRLAKACQDEKAMAELAKSIKVPLSSQRASQLLAGLCRDLHRVNVSTLDAFFSRIASSFRLELDLPLDPQMVSTADPLAVRARAEGIKAVLMSNEPDTIIDLLKRAHHDHLKRSVTQAMDQIISGLYENYRMAPDEEIWTRLPVPKTLDQDNLRFAMEQFVQLTLSNDLPSRYPKSLEKSLEHAQKGDWSAFLSSGIPSKIFDESLEFYRQPIPQPIIDIIHPLVVHAKAVELGYVAHQTRATWELLEQFHEAYESIRKAHRLMMFSDLPLMIAQALGPSGDTSNTSTPLNLDAIYYRLDGQVQHLLLDEFQDTSLTQWRVLSPLAQEIVNHERQDRSFFCVGDTKQSIYGWRGGCAELFDELSSELSPDKIEEHFQNTSWRSSQIILNVVNDIFNNIHRCGLIKPDQAFKQDVLMTWAETFADHTAERKLPGYVEVLTSPPAVDASDDSDLSQDFDPSSDNSADTDDENGAVLGTADAHVTFSATHIQKLVKAHHVRSIGVLVRTNKTVNQLIHQLQQLGVNASGEGGNPVTDDAGVELILAALELADHPGNSVARYHVQRSPLADIVGLEDVSPGGVEVFSQDIRKKLAHEGYAGLIQRWASRLSLHGSKRNATRLSQLVELAQAYQPQATLRPADFVDHVKATPVEEPMPAKVRVMTVHKAKGLEFDIVVLPELDMRIGQLGTGQLCYVSRPTPTSDIQAIYRSTNEATRKLSPELELAYEQEIKRRFTDDLCGMYVAMTRPRQALYMILRPLTRTKNGKISSRGYSDLSPAAIVRKTLKIADEETQEQQSLYSHGDPRWDRSELAAEPAAASPDGPRADDTLVSINLSKAEQSSRSWRTIAPSSLEAGSRVNVADLLRQPASDGRAYGTLVHAMFQEVQWLDNAPLPDDEVEAMIQEAFRQSSQADQVQMDSAGRAFGKALLEPGVRRALEHPSASVAGGRVDLWRERPFAVRLGADLLHGILDRVVVQRDAAGKALSAHLLDYKTDRVTAEGVNPIVVRYRPQILAYRRAVGIMLGLPVGQVAASLLLLSTGESVRVE